jgi:hypothetical protein
MTSSALSDLLVSKLNLQIIVLNIVLDKFLTTAVHHSLLDPVGPPGRDSCGRPAGTITTIPTAGPPNGLFSVGSPTLLEAISARADMSDGDAVHFMLGFAAGAALLWVITETIWMRL